MITRAVHRPTHFGQLFASALAFSCLTLALILTARWIDDDASRWAPVAAACVVLWLFSAAWAVMAVAFTIDGLIADARAPKPPERHKPRPGEGRRPESWSLAELVDAETAWRNRRDADEWAAEDVLAEARHAAGRAA